MNENRMEGKCQCIEEANTSLEKHNLRLDCTAWKIGVGTVVALKTSWIDPKAANKGMKRSPPTVMGSYCPFCGRAMSKEAKL